MDRKGFLKNGFLGVGAIVAGSTLVGSCKSLKESAVAPEACVDSPTEIAGPFPNRTPAEMVRENIVGDRKGVPLLIKIKIENTKTGCAPLAGVFVDVWQSDAKGDYSEYDGQLNGDFTSQHFLRGRQTTDKDGMVSFISIYPGWYPGRAPHLHLEVITKAGKSLLVTQTAFPEDITKAVYANDDYRGIYDTSNEEDYFFGSSLKRNLADSVVGNLKDGYVLEEVLKVTL